MRVRLVGSVAALVAIAIVVLFGCTPPEKSASGFRLPDGDPERGREVFLQMKCNACHVVKGLDLPPPVAEPPVPVPLGGVVDVRPTDGRFVTAIINPSHAIAPGLAKELVGGNGQSRMADYGDLMTVHQLVDLVAFLHSRYEFSPPVR